MTQKVKRALSLFMAAVLCCAALLGLGTTAYAAREQGTVYQIAFPAAATKITAAHGGMTQRNT